MEAFWDYSVWGFFNIFAILLFSLLVANALKYLNLYHRYKNITTEVQNGSFLGL